MPYDLVSDPMPKIFPTNTKHSHLTSYSIYTIFSNDTIVFTLFNFKIMISFHYYVSFNLISVWKEKTSWGSLQINMLMLWVLTELILLYNLWIDHVMSTTHISFTLVLDGPDTDVRYLHGYPLQRISSHLTNPLSSELINMQKKTSSNHILSISTVSLLQWAESHPSI